jgi:predicted nucleotidyltransferase
VAPATRIIRPPEARFYTRAVVSGQPAQESGITENGTMSHMLQLGDTQVDDTKLADLRRRYGVRELFFFGSAAREEMWPDSDIDMLVEFLPEAGIDLVDYAGLMLDLSHLLGRKVDLVSKNGLKPLIRASVLEEARLLYAA